MELTPTQCASLARILHLFGQTKSIIGDPLDVIATALHNTDNFDVDLTCIEIIDDTDASHPARYIKRWCDHWVVRDDNPGRQETALAILEKHWNDHPDNHPPNPRVWYHVLGFRGTYKLQRDLVKSPPHEKKNGKKKKPPKKPEDD
jgi:hypothetical protein